MIQRLGNSLQINIPFKSIFKSERYILRRLHEAVSTGHNYIGQCKLSSRMTIIILAYLFALLQQPDKNKVYYVCQSKQRCKEVKKTAEMLRDYYKKIDYPNSTLQRVSESEIQRQFNLQKSQTVILHGFFHKETNLLKDYPNDKYISILSIKDYFTQIIQQKVHRHSSGTHVVKADYMLVQTVSYDQIIQTCISGWVNQIVIRRAYIQYRKLQTYYNNRDDKRKMMMMRNQNNAKLNQNQKLGDSLKRRTSNSSLEKDHSKQKSHSIFHGNSHKNSHQKLWSISEINKKINEMYILKKEDLLKKNDQTENIQLQNQKKQTTRQPSFQEQAIMALQQIGYLINFFQNYQILTRQSNKMGKDETVNEEYSSAKLILQLEKKTLLKQKNLKKLYDTIKKLVQNYPPLIKPEQYNQNDFLFRKRRSQQPYLLSFKHILHLAKFCKDLIDFNEAFNQKYNQCIQVSKSCHKEKDKPSFFEISFKCRNQPLLTEIILEYNQNFICLMNNGISLDFYSSVFKPKILMKNQGQANSSIIEQEHVQNQKSFKFCFDSPTNVADHIHSNIYGLNVTITPSEQNLKIPQFISKDDDQHDSLIVKAYGVLLYDLCEVVSDGIVVYFPSTSIINKFKKQWIEKQDIYKKINQIKRIFQQTQLQETNNQNLVEYKKICDIGRGAVYLLASNGGMAKYTQFQGHYSRCVVFMGIPKISSQSRKKEHLTEKEKQERKKKENYLNLKEAELETYCGLKTTAKCLSNCVNSHLEPKSIIFADVSYNKQSTKKWFPFIQQGSLNTSQAIDKVKKFHQNSEKYFQQAIQWQLGKTFNKRSVSKNDHHTRSR